MKKKKINKKLSLNKAKISNLNKINGGTYFSGGCTDGCGTFASAWNCTNADCTADCTTINPKVCP